MENIPVGRLTLDDGEELKNGNYDKGVVEKFLDYPDAPCYDNTPDAIELICRLLGEHDKVTIVATGTLRNVCTLIKNHSDLVKEKVEEIAIMGCNFWHENGINPLPEYVNPDGSIDPVCEWNIFCSIPSAQYVFDNCPVKIVCSPFELGLNMFTGKPMYHATNGEAPDSYALGIHGSCEGRHSWDPATALYGIYGASPWFYKTVNGRITITDDGVAHFSSLTPANQYIIECAMSREKIAEEIDSRIMRLFN